MSSAVGSRSEDQRDGPRLGIHQERLQLRPRLTLGLVVQPRHAANPGDQDLADVETNADAREVS